MAAAMAAAIAATLLLSALKVSSAGATALVSPGRKNLSRAIMARSRRARERKTSPIPTTVM